MKPIVRVSSLQLLWHPKVCLCCFRLAAGCELHRPGGQTSWLNEPKRERESTWLRFLALLRPESAANGRAAAARADASSPCD
mgnify:CR=1 FL=1